MEWSVHPLHAAPAVSFTLGNWGQSGRAAQILANADKRLVLVMPCFTAGFDTRGPVKGI